MYKKLILFSIIILASILRLYKLDSYPALNADEAAIGYNAYSLIKTGMDEHGNPWPVHFQSFNDYKPGLYFYLVLPFVKFIGLNELAVRLPNTILGIATVYVLYLLIRELKIKNSLEIGNWKLKIEEIAALFLAISPWHIHFSRGGWEVNTATFFITLGVFCFVKYINSGKQNNLAFSLLSFAFSLYTYHSARIIVPLLALGLVWIYKKEIFNFERLKLHLKYLLVFLIVLIPLFKDFVGPAGISRAAGVGLFSDPGPLTRINEQRGEHIDLGSFSGRLLHNKAVNYSFAFLENWAKHFHGEFLFLSGDEIQRNRVPETGQMYLFDFLFISLGVVFILGSSFLNYKSKLLIFFWLLVAPFASALTFQSPHALRSQNMVIPLTIINAIGFTSILDFFIRKITNRKTLLTFNFLLLTLISWQLARYLHMYYVHMAREYPFSSQYGVKELVNYIENKGGNFERVIVTDAYDQPYILFLFYMKYPPEIFQKGHVLTGKDKYGFSTVRNFGKYEFTTFEFDSMRDTNPKSLIVGTPKEIPDYGNIIEKIYGTNDNEYFRVVAN